MAGTGDKPAPSPRPEPRAHLWMRRAPSQNRRPQGCRRSPAACTWMYARTRTPTGTEACTDLRSRPPTHALGSPLLLPPSHHHRPCHEQLRQPPLPLLSSGLPEEQRADVCSVAICILLDSIIISITPSFHPRSSAFAGSRDGWSLFSTSRRGRGSHAAVPGMPSLATDGEVTGSW